MPYLIGVSIPYHIELILQWAANDINICTVNYGNISKEYLNYFAVSQNNAPLVSEVLGDAILNLNAAGIPLKNITITGHSLGGQIAGLTSTYIKSKSPSSVRIGKIFGE